jgi:VanZ family protein
MIAPAFLTRVWWGFGFFFVGVALFICLVPGRDLPSAFEINDKISHGLGHALLAAWFAGLVPRRSWWKIFLALLAFGICIEFAQALMHNGREGDPRDVVANSCGALFGLLVSRLGLAHWPQWAAWLLGQRRAIS